MVKIFKILLVTSKSVPGSSIIHYLFLADFFFTDKVIAFIEQIKKPIEADL